VIATRLLAALAALAMLGPSADCRASEAPVEHEGARAAISPELARSLFDSVRKVAADHPCALSRFDTHRSYVDLTLTAPSGAAHKARLEAIDTAGWKITGDQALRADCGALLRALEQAVGTAPAPVFTGGSRARWRSLSGMHGALAGALLLLLAASAWIAGREVAAERPPPSALLALLGVTLLALVLRIFLSPPTFLHEYYHIAETIRGYLEGNSPPAYGKAGPALYRLVAAALDLDHVVGVIFYTNAVLAALAVPAVALLSLFLIGRWDHALAAGLLLCVLPHHLRFSASEVLFVPAITLAIWSAALFALYLRKRRLFDLLVGVLALALAMQTRPELMVFPGLVVALVLFLEPRSWRVLLSRHAVVAAALLAGLLAPRLLELSGAVGGGPSPKLPQLDRYLAALFLLDTNVTPAVYQLMLAIGAVWTLRYRPGLLAWVALLFAGYTLSSLSLFDNPPYNLRAQLLPDSFTVLIAAGAICAVGDWLRAPPRAVALLSAAVTASILFSSYGFVRELRDQQLQFAFLDRTIPDLPERGTLLAAIDVGGRRLDAFPTFLLDRDRKAYALVDVRDAAAAEQWPPSAPDLIYYQGMYCYFAFDGEPSPTPMMPVCRAVHERYDLEPLHTETLHTRGYSLMRYARPPYSIGFYRARRAR